MCVPYQTKIHISLNVIVHNSVFAIMVLQCVM